MIYLQAVSSHHIVKSNSKVSLYNIRQSCGEMNGPILFMSFNLILNGLKVHTMNIYCMFIHDFTSIRKGRGHENYDSRP